MSLWYITFSIVPSSSKGVISIFLSYKMCIRDRDGLSADSDVYIPVSDERGEAVAALMALGYNRNEATGAVGKVKAEGLTCEDYIKHALKNLF